jgi:hypothetical protein
LGEGGNHVGLVLEVARLQEAAKDARAAAKSHRLLVWGILSSCNWGFGADVEKREDRRGEKVRSESRICKSENQKNLEKNLDFGSIGPS